WKRSFRLAQLLVPFFQSITEQVIPEDLLAVHSEIVRAGETGVILIEDSADDIEVNEQGEQINVVNEPVNVPSPVNVRLLDENMLLTRTLPASRGENVEGGIASGHPQVDPEIRNGNSSSPVDNIITLVHEECDMQDMREDVLVKKRFETIEQAAPISVDEAVGSIGCHPQSPHLVVTTVESTGDCGMDVGPVKKKLDMDKQREIQAIKAGLPNKTCLRRRPGHSSIDVTPGATLPLVSDTIAVLGSREPVPV
ncbi:hypothetical protein IFM89_026686, partial [Coptis chinensis]